MSNYSEITVVSLAVVFSLVTQRSSEERCVTTKIKGEVTGLDSYPDTDTCVRACSQGSGGSRRGEVPHLPVVKKYLCSHAAPGTRGEVQNAITWSLSTHINKGLSFVLMKLLFALMSLLQAKR